MMPPQSESEISIFVIRTGQQQDSSDRKIYNRLLQAVADATITELWIA